MLNRKRFLSPVTIQARIQPRQEGKLASSQDDWSQRSQLRNLRAQPSGASSSRAAVLLRFLTWANSSCHIHTFLGILFILIEHGCDEALRRLVGLEEAIRSGHAALRRGASANAVAMLLRGPINCRGHIDHVSVLGGEGTAVLGPGTLPT